MRKGDFALKAKKGIKMSPRSIILIAVISIILLSGCGSKPPATEREEIKNDIEETHAAKLNEQGASIGDITWTKTDKGRWDYSATLIDSTGNQIGETEGEYLKGEVSGILVFGPLQWDDASLE